MVKRQRSSNTQPVNSPANIESTVSVRPGVHDDPTGTMTALRDVGDRFAKTANCPEDFFHANEAMYQELTSVLRQMFTIARQNEAQKKPFGPLDELHVQGIDCESIWAELELRNAPLERHVRKALTRLNQSEDISLATDITSDEEEVDEIDALEDEDEDEDEDDQEEEMDQDQDQDRRYSGSNSGAIIKMKMKTRVGQEEDNQEEEEEEDSDQEEDEDEEEDEESKKETDTFFDLEDMEKFADKDSAEDDLDDTVRNEMYGGENDSGSETEFGDSGDEDDNDNPQDDDQDGDETDADSEGESRDGRTSRKVLKVAKNQKAEDSEDSQDLGGGVKHSDFFRQSSGQRPRGSDDDEEGQEDDDGKRLTAHGEHSKRMKGNISFHEYELLAEKPWALRGEIKSQDRPQNSLLEATVDVERATRAPPPPTPELSMTLLDMIKERCLKENWDDVTPREVEGPAVRKEEAPHVSQEKSKQGLADLYEDEFLKKTMGVKEDDPQKDLKDDLKQLFKKLSGKLDALCNFHFTPKAIIPEIKVQADVAAIAMEEVLPSSVADAEALAPEEVYAKKRGRNAEFLGGHEEMSQDERKRTRLSKKAKRRKERRQAEAAQKMVSKINPGLGNKYEKAKMLKEIQGAKNVELAPVTGDAGKEFSTSSKFFAKLQESVRTSVNAAGKDSEGGQEQLSSKGNRRSAQLRL